MYFHQQIDDSLLIVLQGMGIATNMDILMHYVLSRVLEIALVCTSRERDYITDIINSSHELKKTFKAQTKSSMFHCTISPNIAEPPVLNKMHGIYIYIVRRSTFSFNIWCSTILCIRIP